MATVSEEQRLSKSSLFYRHESKSGDMTERGFEEVRRWKEQKKKGEIILMLDGSGIVAKVKVSQYI
jgi:DNA-binding CsgD family transcriptional regulator